MVKTAMVACARRAIVLCDNSKVGPDHFARFAWLSDIDTIITDTGLDDETVGIIVTPTTGLVVDELLPAGVASARLATAATAAPAASRYDPRR